MKQFVGLSLILISEIVPLHGAGGCTDTSTETTVITDAIYACPGTIASGGVYGEDADNLCNVGFSVCESAIYAAELGLTIDICGDDAIFSNPSQFFATKETSDGDWLCASRSDTDFSDFSGRNDVWGCGNSGLNAGSTMNKNAECTVNGKVIFQMAIGNGNWNDWQLPINDTSNEASTYTLTNSSSGGVLCCKDKIQSARTYIVFPEEKSWSDAKAHCGTLNKSLATVVTDGDYANLIEAMAKQKIAQSAGVWTGLNWIDSEGNWVWQDGTDCKKNNGECINNASDASPEWGHGEPNNYEGNDEDCGIFHYYYNTSTYHHNDLPCNDTRPFACSLYPPSSSFSFTISNDANRNLNISESSITSINMVLQYEGYKYSCSRGEGALIRGQTYSCKFNGDETIIEQTDDTVNKIIFESQCAEYDYYIGCYADESDRALRHGPHDYGYTVDSCSVACANYTYFALQHYGWCSCDNSFSNATKYGNATNCPESRLGGFATNDLFKHTNEQCYNQSNAVNAIYIDRVQINDEAKGVYYDLNESFCLNKLDGVGEDSIGIYPDGSSRFDINCNDPPNDAFFKSQGFAMDNNQNGNRRTISILLDDTSQGTIVTYFQPAPPIESNYGCVTSQNGTNPFILYPDDALYSDDGNVLLIMQLDGNLCLYTWHDLSGWVPRFCTYEWHQLTAGNYAVVDITGNLIVYNVNDAEIWRAINDTSILPPYEPITLCVDNCGKAFLYDIDGIPIWESQYNPEYPAYPGYPINDCADATAPTSAPTPSKVCEKDVNYVIDGQVCVAWGDPHFTLWNGAIHDFQGQPDTGKSQYYYVAPCADATTDDMPFTILAKHQKWEDRVVTGIDYITFELFDNDGSKYLLFLSSSIASYIDASNAVNTLYDDNNASVIPITSDAETTIGNRFKVEYTKPIDNLIDVVLTIDDECTVELYMEGYEYFDKRWRMHVLAITPPECYRCFTCGLCGDFKRPKQSSDPQKLETCDGGFVEYYAGFHGDNTFAYDINGNTWEQSYCSSIVTNQTGSPIVIEYIPELGDNFTFIDPCDSSIKQQVIDSCQTARDDASECCDILGHDYCDALQLNCEIDACAASGTNVSAIDKNVAEVLTTTIDFLCDLPDAEKLFDPNNTIATTEIPEFIFPTDAPELISTTMAETTSIETTPGSTSEVCEKGVNYVIDGQICVAWGDPHFTLWNGAIHDFQGQPGTGKSQHYYLKHCADATTDDMPFTILAKHQKWENRVVTGIDYITFELFDNDGSKYLLFLSSSIASYIDESNAVNTLYDDNTASVTSITSDVETTIGNRFKVEYTKPNPNRIDVVLTIDDECTVELYMEGYEYFDGRWRMHVLAITPPECYRCFTCGLCGDFKREQQASDPQKLETCDGGFVEYYAGFHEDNTFAYDINGNTWEQSYCSSIVTNQTVSPIFIEYIPELGDNFTFIDPCDVSIEQQVIDSCQTARDEASECCAIIGDDYCDELQINCEVDACAASGTNASAIDKNVAEVFTATADFLCDLPDAEKLFDPNNTIALTVIPEFQFPTDAPELIISTITAEITEIEEEVETEGDGQQSTLIGVLVGVSLCVICCLCGILFYLRRKKEESDDESDGEKETEIVDTEKAAPETTANGSEAGDVFSE